jgi:hypothetical protein
MSCTTWVRPRKPRARRVSGASSLAGPPPVLLGTRLDRSGGGETGEAHRTPCETAAPRPQLLTSLGDDHTAHGPTPLLPLPTRVHWVSMIPGAAVVSLATLPGAVVFPEAARRLAALCCVVSTLVPAFAPLTVATTLDRWPWSTAAGREVEVSLLRDVQEYLRLRAARQTAPASLAGAWERFHAGGRGSHSRGAGAPRGHRQRMPIAGTGEPPCPGQRHASAFQSRGAPPGAGPGH